MNKEQRAVLRKLAEEATPGMVCGDRHVHRCNPQRRMEGLPVKYQKGFISERDFLAFIISLVLLGVVLGAVLFLGVPALWWFIKPLIHAATA